jgi:hypothetical protein
MDQIKLVQWDAIEFARCTIYTYYLYSCRSLCSWCLEAVKRGNRCGFQKAKHCYSAHATVLRQHSCGSRAACTSPAGRSRPRERAGLGSFKRGGSRASNWTDGSGRGELYRRRRARTRRPEFERWWSQRCRAWQATRPAAFDSYERVEPTTTFGRA